MGTDIEWWTPDTYNGDVVAAEGTGTASNPDMNNAFFPPQGTGSSDSPSLQTAIFTGTFSLATNSNVTFDLGADDGAYLYVDGSLVEGLGGAHSNDLLPTDTVTLAAAARHRTVLRRSQCGRGSLSFDLDSPGSCRRRNRRAWPCSAPPSPSSVRSVASAADPGWAASDRRGRRSSRRHPFFMESITGSIGRPAIDRRTRPKREALTPRQRSLTVHHKIGSP